MREEQIERVMGATVGMYGDLQRNARKSLQEMDGLEFPAIDGTELQQLAVGNGELTWRQQISRPRTTRSENSSATG
ncbi:MAG: hypothetical protein NFW16_07230 [Candidatus Accumulibacter sp.]|uniref:hypothetical protein n=1 Tax=Accumulibacter sp. TaxID=2053492 RepID=UPI0025907F1A|nr:hypothetical protein [Accumulibacter sp.]MCM8621524.1 hypothetical protein [Accumulibacter sp.]